MISFRNGSLELRQMKIVHLIGFFQPEFGYQEYYLAKKQVEMGNKVYVITSDLIYPFGNVKRLLADIKSPYHTRKRPIGIASLDRIKIIRLPHLLEYSDVVIIKGISKWISLIKPNIVHAHELRQITPFLSIFSKKLGYKLIIDQHDYKLSESSLKRFEYLYFRRIFIQLGLLKADAIICIFEAAKRFLKRHYYLDKKPIYVVPNGSETAIYKFQAEKRLKIRNELKISADEVLLIFAGQISREKKLHIQIHAVKRLIDNNYKCRFLIIGSGDTHYIDLLKNLKNKLNLDDKISFLDYMPKERLSGYFSAADIGVFYSRPSIIMQEMMACKLALLVPHHYATKDRVSFKNGLTFRLGNFNDYMSKLKYLLENTKILEEMRENSLKAVENHFSWDNIAKKIQEVYERALR